MFYNGEQSWLHISVKILKIPEVCILSVWIKYLIHPFKKKTFFFFFQIRKVRRNRV